MKTKNDLENPACVPCKKHMRTASGKEDDVPLSMGAFGDWPKRARCPDNFQQSLVLKRGGARADAVVAEHPAWERLDSARAGISIRRKGFGAIGRSLMQ